MDILETAPLEALQELFLKYSDLHEALEAHDVDAADLVKPFGCRLGHALFFRQQVQAPLLEVIRALETGQYRPADPELATSALQHINTLIERDFLRSAAPCLTCGAADPAPAAERLAAQLLPLLGLENDEDDDDEDDNEAGCDENEPQLELYDADAGALALGFDFTGPLLSFADDTDLLDYLTLLGRQVAKLRARVAAFVAELEDAAVDAVDTAQAEAADAHLD